MASSPKPPTPVNPTTVINAETQANRVNRVTPFGSQTYNGNTLETSLPQGTQNAFNNVSEMGGNKQQFLQSPQGFGGLQDAIMNRVSQHYGANGQQPQKSGAQQMPPPIQQLNGQQVDPSWNAALTKIWSH